MNLCLGGFYTLKALNEDIMEKCATHDMDLYVDTVILLLFHMDYLYTRCLWEALHTPPV